LVSQPRFSSRALRSITSGSLFKSRQQSIAKRTIAGRTVINRQSQSSPPSPFAYIFLHRGSRCKQDCVAVCSTIPCASVWARVAGYHQTHYGLVTEWDGQRIRYTGKRGNVDCETCQEDKERRAKQVMGGKCVQKQDCHSAPKQGRLSCPLQCLLLAQAGSSLDHPIPHDLLSLCR
jgi:hypothetical protein